MKVSISVGSAYHNEQAWGDLVEYVEVADRIGVDSVWSAEAWGMDAVASLGYLAARTENIALGSGVMQISARTPATTAMTALALDQISHGRFRLGLGVSGPQVVEGLHGKPFAQPLGRLREYTEIVRKAMSGERVEHSGRHYHLPRPHGEGKPIRLAVAPNAELPIYVAALGPKSLEFTGEVANGWLGTSLVADHADVLIDPIRRGANSRGRSLDDIDLQVDSQLEVSDDVESLIEKYRPRMAFMLGAMGSATTNFYNAAFSRAGYGDVAAEVQRLWVAGDRPSAVAAVPDELVLAAYPIGTADMVTNRIQTLAAAGVNALRLDPIGDSLAERISHLEMCIELASGAARNAS